MPPDKERVELVEVEVVTGDQVGERVDRVAASPAAGLDSIDVDDFGRVAAGYRGQQLLGVQLAADSLDLDVLMSLSAAIATNSDINESRNQTDLYVVGLSCRQPRPVWFW